MRHANVCVTYRKLTLVLPSHTINNVMDTCHQWSCLRLRAGDLCYSVDVQVVHSVCGDSQLSRTTW